MPPACPAGTSAPQIWAVKVRGSTVPQATQPSRGTLEAEVLLGSRGSTDREQPACPLTQRAQHGGGCRLRPLFVGQCHRDAVPGAGGQDPGGVSTGLGSRASCCLPVGTLPCQAGQLGPNFFFFLFFFFRGLHGRRCQHDMLGLNSRKASEQRRAAQVAARCRAGSGEGAHGTATCLPTQAGAAWGHAAHPKAIWGLPSSPAARYCSLMASRRAMSRALSLRVPPVAALPAGAGGRAHVSPAWGWDGTRGGQGTVPSWLCFTALLGAGMEFGWGWAFPGSDSPGQDLAPMTVLRGE